MRLLQCLLAIVAFVPLYSFAEGGPSWWEERNVLDASPDKDFATVNVGQLKNIARAAADELNAKLPGGAGTTINDMVAAWVLANPDPENAAVANVGQVKSIVKLIYDRLDQAGYSIPYPWGTATVDPDNAAPVNIGQLKNLFAFDLNLFTSSDGDSVPDRWELQIVDANDNDSINSVADVLPDGDFDQDGVSNGDEFENGDDPLDPTDGLVPAGKIKVSVAPGRYVLQQIAKISVLHGSAVLRYTLDGNTPDGTSPLVPPGGVLLDGKCTLKVRSWIAGNIVDDFSGDYLVIGRITAGPGTSLMIATNGTVWTWGGDQGPGGVDASSPVPLSRANGLGRVTNAAMNAHTILVDENGRLWSRGIGNVYGAQGIGIEHVGNLTPSPLIFPNAPKIIDVDTSVNANLALDESGEMWEWGYFVGDNTATAHSYQPRKQVRAVGMSSVAAVAHGDTTFFALDTAQKLWSWGAGGNYRLGTTQTTYSLTPAQVSTTSTSTTIPNLSVIDTGYYHSAAIDVSGNIWTWGAGTSGQLGTGGTSHSLPVQVTANGGFTQISTGSNFTVGWANGLWAWGTNSNRQLGDGTTTQSLTPKAITVPDGAVFAQLAAGNLHTIALSDEGYIYGWGSGSFGQVGNSAKYVPTRIDNINTAVTRQDAEPDGMWDYWEKYYFGGYSRDGTLDYDGDFLSDLTEWQIGTDPTEDDTDGDFLSDKYESDHGLNPLWTLDASFDLDADGLSNLTEAQFSGGGSNPNSGDQNGDGFADGIAYFQGYALNDDDWDDDGVDNVDELEKGTSPYLADTDGDSVGDATDPFPLDPRQVTAGGPTDFTGPTITLTTPLGATPIP